LPWIVRSPTTVFAPDLIVPLVSIDDEPVMTVEPVIVPPVISGVLRDLLLKVALPASVTITPVLGKVAPELIPVPPKLAGKIPLTADELLRFSALNVGMPPPSGTERIW